jgi:2-octaprenyl-6-methoxyphenol hydroxylase
VHYDHREVGDDPLGWIVENRHIRGSMIDAIEHCPTVQIVSPASVDSIEQMSNAVRLTTDDGRGWEAALLALADGRHSTIRQTIGIDASVTDYSQSGLVATFRHEQPHRGLAVERFFPDGPFAMLPMTGDRSSIVWALDRSRAERLARLDDDEFTAEVQARFGDSLGALELEGPRWCYPLALVVADAYRKGRIALVGDCAHGIHPIAGQGWNLALRDVAVLAEITNERASLGLDIGDDMALEHYSRWRRTDGMVLVAVTDGINRLFANDMAPVRVAREFGLALVEQIGPAKRLFMLHAMGLIGDVPALMRP